MGQLYLQLSELQSGDPQRAAELITQFTPLIRRRLSELRDRDEGVLQIPFLQALYHLPLAQLKQCREPDHAIIAYLKKTVHHAATAARLAEERQIPSGTEYRDEIGWDIPAHGNEALSLELQDALERLPERQRAVLWYAYFCGYTVAEIAEALHISRQSVNQTKNRALQELKKILD